MHELLHKIGWEVRKELEEESNDLRGSSLYASELIISALKKERVSAKSVEGWCVYDEFTNYTNAHYDDHVWIEVADGKKVWYVDVTATQFQFQIDVNIPKVIVGERPYYMSYKEPSEYDLQEISW